MANPFIRLDDLARILRAVLKTQTSGRTPTYDAAKGEYTNLGDYWAQHATGDIYGTAFPTYSASNSPDGVKVQANANLTIEPSTNTTMGRDDYATLNPFRVFDVNATVGDDGIPHVTAIRGYDNRYRKDGTNGDVWVMAAPLYYRWEETGTTRTILISDMPHAGYSPAPGVTLPDGGKRGFMLYAKYPAVAGADGLAHSFSGADSIQNVSTATCTAWIPKRGKGYSGLTTADVWYWRTMLMVKYGTRNSDVLGGDFNHNSQNEVLTSENGTHRVIVSNTAAAWYHVGSYVNIGTNNDRGYADNYKTARMRGVVSKTTIDATHVALNLDGDAFDAIASTSAAKQYVTSMPYKTGATDDILGVDGRPWFDYDKLRQPIRLQGIELFTGRYENQSDIILNLVKDSDDLGHVDMYRTYDMTKASSSGDTTNYKLVGTLPSVTKTQDGNWQYQTDVTCIDGYYLPTGTGGTSTTGLCDAMWINPITHTDGAQHALHVGGALGGGSVAGLFCVCGWGALGWAHWYCAGRLSALGRSKA